jgi:hypothetical protein
VNTSVFVGFRSREGMPSRGSDGRRPVRVPGRLFARLAAVLAGLALALSLSGVAFAAPPIPGWLWISGTITGPDGTGLANFVTTAQDTHGVFFAGGLGSDSSGHYEINVPPGTYTVHANDYRDTKQSNSASIYYPGCYQGCTPVTVTNADVSGIDIVMQFYLHISGTVTGPDGKPAANIQVHAWSTNSNFSINVSANGTFSLRVDPGSYEVRLVDSSSIELGCYGSGATGNFAFPGSCTLVAVSTVDVSGIGINMAAATAATPTPAPTASPTASENTASGTSIDVSPVVSGGSAAGITLTFTQVSAPGTTSVAVSNTGPPVPGTFVSLASSPTYYDVSTTAAHTGSITLCVPYDPTAYPDPSLVRLLHWNGASWDDVTSSVDSATATVCGSTTSLSPFVVAQRVSAPAASTVGTPDRSPASSAANSTTSPTSGGLFVGLIVAVVLVASVLLAAWWLTRRRRIDQARR